MVQLINWDSEQIHFLRDFNTFRLKSKAIKCDISVDGCKMITINT